MTPYVYSFLLRTATESLQVKFEVVDLNVLQEFGKLMDYVSPIVPDIDMHTERRLMRKLEQRELDVNKEYLREFEQVRHFLELKIQLLYQIRCPNEV